MQVFYLTKDCPQFTAKYQATKYININMRETICVTDLETQFHINSALEIKKSVACSTFNSEHLYV